MMAEMSNRAASQAGYSLIPQSTMKSIATESRDEKKARLLRELEELKKEEEDARKANEELKKAEEELKEAEEEVKSLERQLEVARERVRQRQMDITRRRALAASRHDEKESATNPPTIKTPSTAATRAQPTADRSLSPNGHVPPSNSVSCASSSKMNSNGFHPMTEDMHVESLGRIEMSTYYAELETRGNGKAQSFRDMSLDQLCKLAANEEDAEEDADRTEPDGHIHYFIFLKTHVIEDLEKAIRKAEGRIPVKIDHPDYASRLKDLIVMLIKKYKHTASMDDLQETIFRAQEMVAVPPLDHPDRPVRMTEWINMMFEKCNYTRSQEDLDEAVIAAREAGAVVSIDELDSSLRVGIPRLEGRVYIKIAYGPYDEHPKTAIQDEILTSC